MTGGAKEERKCFRGWSVCRLWVFAAGVAWSMLVTTGGWLRLAGGWQQEQHRTKIVNIDIVVCVGRAMLKRFLPRFRRSFPFFLSFWNIAHTFVHILTVARLAIPLRPLPVALYAQIRQQALIALEEATAVVMVVDGQSGCNVLDLEIARFLRQQKVPVVLAVNKCESQVREPTCVLLYIYIGYTAVPPKYLPAESRLSPHLLYGSILR